MGSGRTERLRPSLSFPCQPMPTPGHLPTRHSPAIGTGHHGASGVPGDTGDVQTLGLGWGVAQSMQAGDLQHTMCKPESHATAHTKVPGLPMATHLFPGAARTFLLGRE